MAKRSVYRPSCSASQDLNIKNRNYYYLIDSPTMYTGCTGRSYRQILHLSPRKTRGRTASLNQSTPCRETPPSLGIPNAKRTVPTSTSIAIPRQDPTSRAQSLRPESRPIITPRSRGDSGARFPSARNPVPATLRKRPSSSPSSTSSIASGAFGGEYNESDM